MRSVICVAVVLWSLTAYAGSMVDGLSVTEFFAKFERSAIKLNDSGMQLTRIRRQHSSSRSGLYGPTRSRWYSSAQTALCVRARNEPRWPLMTQTKRRPRDMGTRKRCDDSTLRRGRSCRRLPLWCSDREWPVGHRSNVQSFHGTAHSELADPAGGTRHWRCCAYRAQRPPVSVHREGFLRACRTILAMGRARRIGRAASLTLKPKSRPSDKPPL